MRKLLTDLKSNNPEIWGLRRNVAGREGVFPAIKLMAGLRALGTGKSYDDRDDACSCLGKRYASISGLIVDACEAYTVKVSISSSH